MVNKKTLQETPKKCAHKVDVIVPTYNYGHFLDACLKSVVGQTFTDFEVLVIDNASDDDTPAIMERWLSRDSRIRYVRNETNIGTVGSGIKSYQMTNGKYVVVLSADDIFLPEFLEKTVGALEAHPECSFAYSNWCYFKDGSDEELGGMFIPHTKTGIYDETKLLMMGNWITGSFTVWRRANADAMGGLLPEDLPMLCDHYLWMRLSSTGPSFYVADSLGRARIHGENETNKLRASDRAAVDHVRVWDLVFQGENTWTVPVRLLAKASQVRMLTGMRLGDAARAMVSEAAHFLIRSWVTKYKADFFTAVAECILRFKNQDTIESGVGLLKDVLRDFPDHAAAKELYWEFSDETASYASWGEKKVVSEGYGKLLAERMMYGWVNKPSFHFVTYVTASNVEGFLATYESLCRQIYSGWGLSVISDLGCPIENRDGLENLEWIQAGIEWASALQTTVDQSPAEWMAFIEAGDQLEPHALATVADYANIRPRWLFVYSDEDLIREDGTRAEPVFKPEFNLDLARSMPFVGRFAFTKTDVLRELGCSCLGRPSQLDLALQVYDAFGADAIGHVSDVLYHRNSEGWLDYLKKTETDTRDAVGEHLARTGVAATIGEGLLPGTLRIVYTRNGDPAVTIIIPNKNSLDVLRECVDSVMERTSYKNFDVLIVDNGSDEEDVLRYYAELGDKFRGRVSVIEAPGGFNFSSMNNRAAEVARGEYLVLLNNDTQIVQGEWLGRLLNHAIRPEVGVVGARLVFPGTDTLQHAGVILGLQGPANHIFLGASIKDAGYMGRAQVDQEFSAVTAACMMVRKSVYLELGGLDEEAFKVSYNDVDFCLRARERGYKVVWTPYSIVVHHGSVSQKKRLDTDSDDRAERFQSEQAEMYARWLPSIANDPAYNVNLSLARLGGEVEGELVAGWDRNFHDRPRIVGQPLTAGATGDLRVIGPLRALDKSARAQTMTLFPLQDPSRKGIRTPSLAEMARLETDVLLIQSPILEGYLEAMESYKKHLGLFQVYDLEDLKLPDGIPDWNSRKRFIPKDMGVLLRRGLAICDRLLVTTEPLAEAHRNDIDDIRIVPNYLDGSKWTHLTSKRRAGKKPRVGWAGAQQHHGDLEILTSVVKETAEEIEWVFFGLWPEELEPYVETHAFGPYGEYPRRLAALNLDIAVAPLERNPFNVAKSNLRLLEYGILGWPVVCSDIEPYRDAPVARVENTAEAWLEAIRERIYDLDAAEKEGEKLRAWVRNNWMLEDHLDEFLRALLP